MHAFKTVVFIACLAIFPACSADRVDIQITGDIVASPCIFNGGDNNLNVNLGDIYASNMATPHSQSVPVDFALRFTQCPAGTRSVDVQFSGVTDPVAGDGYYKNSGTAGHVAIGLQDLLTGNAVGSGTRINRPVDTDKTITLDMKAWVYSTEGAVTPGTINSVVVLTMQYN
ncbi:TPA: type 1 fimbrial protein [Enterobacter asburiae]|nr:type 1 fimbrial protein [Enterobacter asburiae]